MEQFLNLVITGAVTGAIFSLVASSLVLSYSASGIFNLSYGAVAFLSAYLYFELTAGLGWPVGIAAVVVVGVFAPLLGWTLDRLVFRRLASAADGPKIMATVGLLVALPALGRWIVERLVDDAGWQIPLGDNVYSVPGLGPTPKRTYSLPFGTIVDSNQLIVFGAAILVAIGLWYLLRRTRLGLHMRAHVDRPALAAYRGIDGARTSSITWMLATMLAALAGVIGAPVLNSLDPLTYNTVLFVAACAAVLGGLRSIPIAFAGGLVLGVAQNLVLTYATFAKNITGFNASVPFVLLLGGLLWMSRKGERRAGSVADTAPPIDPNADLPVWRRRLPWVLSGGALVIYVAFLADAFWAGLIAHGLALSLIFLSFVVVTGIGGMVSLAQAAFVTAAALSTGMLLARGWPLGLSMLGGVATAVVLGVLCALPAIRLSGLSLALATLALAFVGDRVLFAWDAYRNATSGWTIPRLAIGPIDLADDRTMALVLLALILGVCLLIRNLRTSVNGRAMIAVRSSEPAAATVGVSPLTTKLKIFAISAAIAGVGGVLLASFKQSATSVSTPAESGLLWLATVVLFGIRRPAGAILAGLAVVISPQIWQEISLFGWDGHQSSYLPAILFGLGAVTLSKNPEGILAVTATQNAARRARWRARAAARRGGTVAPEPTIASPATTAAAAAPTVAGEPTVVVTSAPHHGGAADLEPLLVARSLTSGYGELLVVHDLSVSLAGGSITALLGANGAGKSTLCATLAGGLPVTEGSIQVEGAEVTDRPAHWRARNGLVLAPESRGVFPGLTVEENLAVWLPDRADIERAVERFAILHERRRLPAGDLSGGEQQILTLAPLLVRPPAVLIADEPTLGLAPLIVQQVLDILVELRNDGVAVLLVEEKVRSLLEVADTAALLQLGRIVWVGDADAVQDTELATAYLGVA